MDSPSSLELEAEEYDEFGPLDNKDPGGCWVPCGGFQCVTCRPTP